MAATADDARHSLLGKVRPLAQRSLEHFLEGQASRVPRADFGRYEVREVEVKSALTPCAMPGQPWTVNPYAGCSHDCAYCYVPDVAHMERAKWGSYVVVKRNLPTLLAHELKRKEPRPVFLSSATDPYQPAERDHLVTQRSLEILRRHDWPLSVLTRNPLLRRDLPLIASFSDVSVGMSVPTLDDEMRRLVEPGAPPIEGRLRTLRAMADEGLAPFANLAPAYPLTGGVTADDVAQAFADAGVRAVYASAWRYLDTVLPHLEARLPEEEREPFVRAVRDPATYERLFRDLRRALEPRGVEFVVMGMSPVRGKGALQDAA
jgi:DNA repair photolyase